MSRTRENELNNTIAHSILKGQARRREARLEVRNDVERVAKSSTAIWMLSAHRWYTSTTPVPTLTSAGAPSNHTRPLMFTF